METEMKELSRGDSKGAEEDTLVIDRSPGSESHASAGSRAAEGDDDGGGSRDEDVESGRSAKEQPVVKRDTVVVRLGEGKLTGPMRYITCYATVFTFVVMTGGIVWLLMISPPYNPVELPGRGSSATTTTSPLTSDTPFSTFMVELDVDEAG
ncbi:uncharacterized protein LOC125036987 [Penaeus chinensis]|uniref:uncharacterized protein LOC125036987 n=1 Tax=Penaeus chinensis TaxID=139456 RepID=UPI001FB706C0|nr:uncharacterized protein LOC125036987 [Penaeus chinensis]